MYVDVELDGLSFNFLKLESFAVYEDHEIILPVQVYSFAPHDFYQKDEKMETTNMNNDALISVIDGQSLRLSKINNLLDPLVVTYRGHPTKTAHTAIFSLDSVNDVDVIHEE